MLGEAVQTVMRLHGLDNPYERLKELTRGKKVDGPAMATFVRGLGLPDDVTERLVRLTPQTYTGIADELVDHLTPVVVARGRPGLTLPGGERPGDPGAERPPSVRPGGHSRLTRQAPVHRRDEPGTAARP